MNLNSIQISLFGNFTNIKPDLETMKLLTDTFQSKSIFPTVSNHQNIDMITGINSSELRVVLVTLDGRYNINILPERIDYLSKFTDTVKISDSQLSNEVNSGSKILSELLSVLKIKSNRLALNIQFIYKNIEKEDLAKIYSSNINFLEFYNQEKVIEWQLMSNARVSFEDPLFSETLNVISFVMPAMNVLTKTNGLMLQLDVNTLQDNLDLRFESDNLEQFYTTTIKIVNDLYSQFLTFIDKHGK